jgi:hypothetical protein
LRFVLPFFAAFLAAFSGSYSTDSAFATIFDGLGLFGATGPTVAEGGSFFFGTDYLFFVGGGGPVRVAGLLGFGLAGGAGTTVTGLEGGAGFESFIGGSLHVAAGSGARAAPEGPAPRTSTGSA